MKQDFDPFSCFLEDKNDSQEYRSQANWARGVLARLAEFFAIFAVKDFEHKGREAAAKGGMIAPLHFYDYPRTRFDPSIIRFLWIWG
jgi:hypothetical protein